MKNKEQKSASRRDFLRAAGLGVGIAAAAGTSLKSTSADASNFGEQSSDKSYKETEHIRKYYELARM